MSGSSSGCCSIGATSLGSRSGRGASGICTESGSEGMMDKELVGKLPERMDGFVGSKDEALSAAGVFD